MGLGILFRGFSVHFHGFSVHLGIATFSNIWYIYGYTFRNHWTARPYQKLEQS